MTKDTDALEKLLTLIETADEHGDECAIVEQAAVVRAALAHVGPVAVRPYPQLLDKAESKALLTKAESLWADLQANNLGGFSGINRPFYILHEFRSVIEEFGNRDVGLSWSKDQLNAAKAPAPDTIGSHFGNGGGLDPAAGDVALLDAAKVLRKRGDRVKFGQSGFYVAGDASFDSNVADMLEALAHPPHPAPVDGDEAVRLLRGIVRLSEMGFEASMREPEEDGNYAVYTRAKAFLDGHPSSVALSEALRNIPDEVYRHIAESKDVAHARSRVADLIAQLPLPTPVGPVAGGEGLREKVARIIATGVFGDPWWWKEAFDDGSDEIAARNRADDIYVSDDILAALKGQAE